MALIPLYARAQRQLDELSTDAAWLANPVGSQSFGVSA